MQPEVDLVISGKYLVPGNGADTVFNTAVAVQGERIYEIGEDLERKYPEAQHLSSPYGLIMPGLVNAHSHAAMSCFRGLADDLPLMVWLQEHIFPVEAQLNSEMVFISTLLSTCEMIKSGTTTFNDMYLFAEDVARAVAQSGMRAWLGEVLYDFPSPNYGELENGFAYTENLFAAYADNPLIEITVNPHAVYTCSPELLQQTKRIAEQHDALYHIHLAENQDEVATCTERYGCSPVQHLHNLGVLDSQVVAAHCVMVNDQAIALLADNQVRVVHCPESNMKLASGTAPIPVMLEKGITVGLGTDGSASNNDVDMFGEMNTAAKIHKAVQLDPTAMNAAAVLHAATMGGAQLLGAGAEIGSLEVGKKADIIVLDMNQPHLTPLYNPLSHLVYAARGGDVVHSVINGKVVMENRKITTLDEEEIVAEMSSLGRHIRQIR